MKTSADTTSEKAPAQARAGSARIPLQQHPNLLGRVMYAWSRRLYGEVLEPGRAMMHNQRVLISVLRFERSVERWSSLDTSLKDLACAAVSAQIGCSWCIDFGWYLSRGRGMTEAKLTNLGDWRSSTVYRPLERRVIEYAEAMTSTPPVVTDLMVERLRADLTDAQLVELTEMIAVENLRSRTNSALGLRSQGLKDHCEVPIR